MSGNSLCGALSRLFHTRDAAHALEEPIPIVGYVRKPVEFGMLSIHDFAVVHKLITPAIKC